MECTGFQGSAAALKLAARTEASFVDERKEYDLTQTPSSERNSMTINKAKEGRNAKQFSLLKCEGRMLSDEAQAM